MKERRSALGRANDLAASVVAGVKRRQAARAPKILLYDEDGRPRTIDAATDSGAGVVEVARLMVDLLGPDEHAANEVPEEE